MSSPCGARPGVPRAGPGSRAAFTLALLLLLALSWVTHAGAAEPSLLAPRDPSLLFAGATDLASGAVAARARVTARRHFDGRPGGTPKGAGASAILLDSAGYLVTAAHVATALGASLQVTTADGQVHRARLVHSDPQRELALLRIAPFEGMLTARTGRRRPLAIGESVVALGSTRGGSDLAAVGRVLEPPATDPLTYHDFSIEHAVVLRMSILPGFSGGPVVDADGQLVAMVASFALDHHYGAFTTRTAYAVPLADILDYRDRVLDMVVAAWP